MSVTELAWLTPVELFKAFDDVGHVFAVAVVVVGVHHGMWKYCR